MWVNDRLSTTILRMNNSEEKITYVDIITHIEDTILNTTAKKCPEKFFEANELTW